MFALSSLLIALGGVLVAVTVAFFKGRTDGAKAERTKQAKAEIGARDMADEIQDDVGSMPPEIARRELGRWARK